MSIGISVVFYVLEATESTSFVDVFSFKILIKRLSTLRIENRVHTGRMCSRGEVNWHVCFFIFRSKPYKKSSVCN
jgi:hypothetical protein